MFFCFIVFFYRLPLFSQNCSRHIRVKVFATCYSSLKGLSPTREKTEMKESKLLQIVLLQYELENKTYRRLVALLA